MNSRVLPQLIGVCIGLFAGVPITVIFAPVFVIFIWRYNAPTIASGLFTSDSSVQQRWYLRRQLPYSIPMTFMVELPLALFLHLHFVLFTTIIPTAMLLYEVFHACSICCGLGKASGRVMDARAVDPQQAPSENREPPDLQRPESETSEWQKSGLLHAAADRYRLHNSVWEVLYGSGGLVQPGDVRLIRLSWLLKLGESGGVLPNRQDLESGHREAFISADELRQIEKGAKSAIDISAFRSEVMKMGSKGIAGFFHVCNERRTKRNVDKLLPIISLSYCWLAQHHPDPEGEQLKLLCAYLKRLYGGRGLLQVCQDYGFNDMGVRPPSRTAVVAFQSADAN